MTDRQANRAKLPGATVEIERVHLDRGVLIVANDTIRDGSLSFRARGLLAYLLSVPPGWRTSAERLANDTVEGRDAIRTALRELEQHRYLIRTKRQGSDGRWRTTWRVREAPTTDFQSSDSQASLLSTEDSAPRTSPSGEGTSHSSAPVEPPRSARRGQRKRRPSREEVELTGAIHQACRGDDDAVMALVHTPAEESLVLGMLSNGEDPMAIARTVLARRRSA